MRKLFGQKPKPVRPDDSSNRIDPFIYDNTTRPQQPPESRRFSSPTWDEDLPPAPTILSRPTYGQLLWGDDIPVVPSLNPPRGASTPGDDLWSVIGDSGASEAGTIAGSSRRPGPTVAYDSAILTQPTIAPYSSPLNPIVRDPQLQTGLVRKPAMGPSDWTIVENTENVPEGSIHSQKERIWSRNLFGNSGNNKEANELMRMIAFITATASDDWALILEVCERASVNESNAKEATVALRREFKYAEPPAQLSAARLWAIMLQNSADIFIAQTASKKFLDNLGGVISDKSTSPVVRERLLEVLASATYHYGKKPGKEGFMSLWRKVRPLGKPIEGVPFDREDPMFAPPIPQKAPTSREIPTPVQAPKPLRNQPQTLRSPPSPKAPSRLERDIIPVEEDIRRLFQECNIAKNNVRILSEALIFATPSTLGTDPVIQEFHAKCSASQELLVAQIPWASAMAERARQNNGNNSSSSDLTKEERLLEALLNINVELIEVFRVYEEMERLAHGEEEPTATKNIIDKGQTRLPSNNLPISSRQDASSLWSRSQAPPEPVNVKTEPPPPAQNIGFRWMSAEEEKRRLRESLGVARRTAEIDKSSTIATETDLPAYTAYNESQRQVSTDNSEERSAAPQSAGIPGVDASTPPPNEKTNVPTPAYDDFDLPRWQVNVLSARVEEHKPSIHPASVLPTHKVSEIISNDTETTSVVLNPYTFESSSRLKGADLYKSAVANNAKSISPTPNSSPSNIAPSPLVRTPAKETDARLTVEMGNSKRTESRAEGQSMSMPLQGNATKAAEGLSENDTFIGGAPPFEYRPDAKYSDPNVDAWAQYYAQGGTDLAGAVYFLSVPGIKEAATAMPSPIEFNVPTYSAESTQDSGETASYLPTESIHTSDGFPELERLMQEKVPLDLTGEVTVANYRKLKHGGFALVYKGVWKGKEVAVKVLKATKNSRKPAPWEASMLRRLTREINVWAALSHRNIAEFLGFADDFGDFPAMISTWCNPGTARDYLDDNEDITIRVRIRLVQDVADGIEYLHQLRIIHGDLKPTNVLIDDNYVARLCDFGLVRLDDWQGPAGMTTTSPYTGTERYKAPELFITIDNSHPIATSEGDIWALGCIALEFIDTRLPYEQYHHSAALAKAIADGESPASRPKTLDTDSLFSQHLWYLLEACWSWYPENRFNAGQIVEELAQLSDLQIRTAQT